MLLVLYRCWIGKKHLDTAMQHLADDFEFHIRWKPFLLNPFLPEQGIPIMDYLRLKFGDEAAAQFLSGSSPVATQGRSLVSSIKTTMTFDCDLLFFTNSEFDSKDSSFS